MPCFCYKDFVLGGFEFGIDSAYIFSVLLVDFDGICWGVSNSLAFCSFSLEVLALVMIKMTRKMRTSWQGPFMLFGFCYVVLVHFIVICYNELLQFFLFLLVFFRKNNQ